MVILSDVGSDTLLFYLDRTKAPMGPNKLKLIRSFVQQGGGLAMIGGWSSFGGHGGNARYHDTPIEEILPVLIKDGDERVEVPEGCTPEDVQTNHPIMKGLDWKGGNIILTGYNKMVAKEGTETLASSGSDPLIVVWELGKGRSMAFATDCAPHWAGTFIRWGDYSRFWIRVVRWLAKRL